MLAPAGRAWRGLLALGRAELRGAGGRVSSGGGRIAGAETPPRLRYHGGMARHVVSFPCGCVAHHLDGAQPSLAHCALHAASPLLRTVLRDVLAHPNDPQARLQALRALMATEGQPASYAT
jgi:hypothetical protein